MFAIFKKEMKSYFYSPIAYALIGVFYIFLAIIFLVQLIASAGNGGVQNGMVTDLLGTANFVLIFIIPLLTMRIFAEERKNKVDVLLVSSPVNSLKIVLGKFLSVTVVFLILTASTVAFPIVVSIFSKVNWTEVLIGYLGFILVGMSFISIGLLTSAITENQIIAAVIACVSLFILMLFDQLGSLLGDKVYEVIKIFSLFDRYQDFKSSILSVAPIVYYITFIAMFVAFTVRAVEKRRWV